VTVLCRTRCSSDSATGSDTACSTLWPGASVFGSTRAFYPECEAGFAADVDSNGFTRTSSMRGPTICTTSISKSGNRIFSP
jgi:hypothetical protein